LGSADRPQATTADRQPKPPAAEQNPPLTTHNRHTEQAISAGAPLISLLAPAPPNALRFKLLILYNQRQEDLVESLVGDPQLTGVKYKF
jgi:hypothetical protein